MSDNRVLLITLSNIGDAVMTTPVLQSLHNHYPDAIIDIVGDQRSSEIFLNCPYRGELFNKDKRKLLRGGPELIWNLRKRKYDLVVDLRTDGLVYLLRTKKRLDKRQRKPYGVHAVEQHMGIIRSIHGNEIIPDCCIWPGEKNERYAKEKLGEYSQKNILGLGPGANWPGKIWPEKKYLALIDAVKNDFNVVVLLGDKRDRHLTDIISENASLPVINLCGETGLLQAAAIQKQMRVFIGNDSGLGHLASAVNIPTLTIFGEGQPERYHPWGHKASWLVGANRNINDVAVADVVACLKDIVTI